MAQTAEYPFRAAPTIHLQEDRGRGGPRGGRAVCFLSRFSPFPLLLIFLLSSPCCNSDSKLCLPGVCVTAFPGAPGPPAAAPGAARGRGGKARGGSGRLRPKATVRGARPRQSRRRFPRPRSPRRGWQRSWHGRRKRGPAADFQPCDRGKATGKWCGESQPVRGSDERASRSRLFAAALSKVRVKCDTPAKWEQQKLPSTRP